MASTQRLHRYLWKLGEPEVKRKNISYPPHPLLLHVVEGVSKSVTAFVFSDHAARIVSVVLIVMERQTVRGKDILMMWQDRDSPVLTRTRILRMINGMLQTSERMILEEEPKGQRGRELQSQSSRDDRFCGAWNFPFSNNFAWVGKLSKYFFGCLGLSRDFFGYSKQSADWGSKAGASKPAA